MSQEPQFTKSEEAPSFHKSPSPRVSPGVYDRCGGVSLTPQLTQDGSYTFFSEEFQEAFHSYHGAKQEAEIKFIKPTQIRDLASKSNSIRILDICYGLSYNSAAALDAIWDVNYSCYIELVGLEITAAVPQQAVANNLLSLWKPPVPQLLSELATNHQVTTSLFQGNLLLGDARETIQQLCQKEWQADAIFLDPFSPPKCPQLWTVEFIAKVAQCLKPTGKLATYSCAAAVRTALSLAGLKFGSTRGLGRKSPGTVASFKEHQDQHSSLPPISLQEQEHLQTRAAIPYRDIHLRDSTEIIQERRRKEQEASELEPTSQWKKRWLLLKNKPNKSP
ncbi:MAG: MnmC family methyltransferase [Xenococcaceae cyanobacterium MO_207.B15]|nr:MnmC family methyltransferase [Xenococcaceae cyanobacterium MO_207.B15]